MPAAATSLAQAVELGHLAARLTTRNAGQAQELPDSLSSVKLIAAGHHLDVPLSEGLVEELVARLDRFGAPDTGHLLIAKGAIRYEDVPVVREVLGTWLRSAGHERFDAELQQLRDELARVASATSRLRLADRG